VTLSELIERVEKGETSNELDVAIEITLFNPDVAIRANAAGSKVIYTKRDGSEATHLAWDWTLPRNRPRTLTELRHLSAQERDDDR